MTRQRYGDYEAINGAIANRLTDEVEQLERIQQAALEVVSGMDVWDLMSVTGIKEDRCKELLHMLNPDAR